MMAIAQSATGAVRIDEATLERDRRAAEQPMGVWQIADGLWGIGTGADDYSEDVVDVHEGRCTCDDWRYRGEPGRGKISRCKHLARIGMVLEEVHSPADADVCRSLEAQRQRWSR